VLRRVRFRYLAGGLGLSIRLQCAVRVGDERHRREMYMLIKKVLGDPQSRRRERATLHKSLPKSPRVAAELLLAITRGR